MSDGTTTGVWIPEGSDLLERYDATFEGSRSRHIMEAMELHMTVRQTLDKAGYSDVQDPKPVQSLVRQAILDMARDEGLLD